MKENNYSQFRFWERQIGELSPRERVRKLAAGRGSVRRRRRARARW